MEKQERRTKAQIQEIKNDMLVLHTSSYTKRDARNQLDAKYKLSPTSFDHYWTDMIRETTEELKKEASGIIVGYNKRTEYAIREFQRQIANRLSVIKELSGTIAVLEANPARSEAEDASLIARKEKLRINEARLLKLMQQQADLEAGKVKLLGDVGVIDTAPTKVSLGFEEDLVRDVLATRKERAKEMDK